MRRRFPPHAVLPFLLCLVGAPVAATAPTSEATLPAERAAAALMAVGIPRVQDPSQAREWIVDRPVSLLLLYSSEEPMDETIRRVRAMVPAGADGPLFAIDQEGGTVLRYAPAQIPGAMAFGAAGSVTLTRRGGRAVGCRLSRAGFDVALAPVLDVASPEDEAGLGTRSFGATPALVAAHGEAFTRGLVEGGVLPVVKHFPGMGFASADPHHGLAAVPGSETVLEARDLAPFRRVLPFAAGTMPAHVSYPSIGPLPATFSSDLLTRRLRNEMSFEGVVITDVLHMEGAFATWSRGERAVRAIEAGADLVLVVGAREARATWLGLRDAIESGRLPASRVEASLRRIARLRARPERPRECEEDAAIAREIADAAVTAIWGGARPPVEGTWFVGEDGALASRFAAERRVVLSPSPPRAEIVRTALQLAERVPAEEWIVLATRNRAQVALARELERRRPGGRLMLVHLGAPQDTAGTRADGWIFTYGFLPQSQEAAARVLFDGCCAPGRLPVAVRGVAEEGAGEQCVSSGARGSR